jgi:ribosomal protein RSM22 (predicted rRNA methylase)
MIPRSRAGRRYQLRQHGPAFLAWLDEDRIFDRVFGLLATDLEEFLLEILHDTTTGKTFMEAIPDVMRRCNDEIYDLPLRPEAYAFMHLLERYRRTWRVLKELTRTGELPLARYGVRTLDVGTGPAPVLYAVNDFYGSLRQFAGARQIDALRLPDPELSAVEGSHGMRLFVHHFSEWTRRTSGPFRAEWRDFAEFDPAGRRTQGLKARVAQIAEEDDTSEAFARWWVHQNEGWLQGAHTYRLCFFSNFLTTREVLGRFHERVNAAFAAVTSGGVVVITGADARNYQPIYEAIQQTAQAAGISATRRSGRLRPAGA